MRSDVVPPVHELMNILEPFLFPFYFAMKSLQLAIGLRVIYSRKNVSYVKFYKLFLKLGFASFSAFCFICIELRSVTV